jgi:hypothetical protein
MVPPPKKQLRWGRVIFALALLAGLIGGGIYLIVRH